MINVLGIETSCDETAAAVAADAKNVRASIVASQIAMHAPYGGVVPEIAARAHVENLPKIVAQAMEQAQIGWQQIQAVAVTYGPGLATALLPGIAAAKGLALYLRLPLIGINHIEAHLYSPFLGENTPPWHACMPFLALIVSGGHTALLRAEAPGRYRLLGATMDDAAGEAFDKGAQLLGLGYPGGPAIENAAKNGRANAVKFPRGTATRGSQLNFSFSGLKTSLRYYLEKQPQPLPLEKTADIAASYQAAIIATLIKQTARAIQREKFAALVAAGGVTLNQNLRQALQQLAADFNLPLFLPQPSYCSDNAAMVAALAAAGGGQLDFGGALDAVPDLTLGKY